MDGYDCQECGQRVSGAPEFHSYESCLLYKFRTNVDRLTTKDRNYVLSQGLQVMAERVERKEVPAGVR